MSGLSAVNLGAVGPSKTDLVDYVREVLRRRLVAIEREFGVRGAAKKLATEAGVTEATISYWVRGAPRTGVSWELEEYVAKLEHHGDTGAVRKAAAAHGAPQWMDFSPMGLQALGILAVRRRGIDFVRSAKTVLANHKPELLDAAALATLIEQNHDGPVGDAGDDQATGEEALRAAKKRKKK